MIERAIGESRAAYPMDSPRMQNHASFMSDDERLAMNWIAHQSRHIQRWEQEGRNGATRPPRVFEIGTFWGLSLVEFSRMLPGAELHSLNILPEQVEGQPAQGEILELDRIGWYARSKGVPYTQHLGDSRHFDYARLPIPVDVAFIDGRHEYDYIRNDTDKVLPLIESGGVIAWHDYARHNSVARTAADAIEKIDRDVFSGGLTHISGTSLVYWAMP